MKIGHVKAFCPYCEEALVLADQECYSEGIYETFECPVCLRKFVVSYQLKEWKEIES